MAMSVRWKVGLWLWLAGMLGVVAMAGLVLPRLLATLPEMLGPEVAAPGSMPPVWVLVLASVVQSAALLGAAVWGGVALSPAVGLRAPGFEAAVSGQSILGALRSQWVPGIVAGAVGGVVLAVFGWMAPAQVQAVQGRIAMPLVVRVLYGGITEEVLLRWGFMTLMVWMARRSGLRASVWVWIAIVVSALVFAMGHLPAAAILAGPLTPSLVGYVMVANTLFGVVFGYLFWRFGLEAAILAHALTHVVCWMLVG